MMIERNVGYQSPILFWGNLENRNGRTSYGKIREYIFAALVARTEIDYLALDKGEIEPSKVVDISGRGDRHLSHTNSK